MNMQPMTLNIPESLYIRLKQRAQQNLRTVEAETLDVLAAHISRDDQLPADLELALAEMAAFDDQALWQAAKSHIESDAATRMEELHWKQRNQALNQAEAKEVADLERIYERTLLVRSQAAALLHQRGHNVNVILGQP